MVKWYCVRHVLVLALLGLGAGAARSGVDVGVANGDKVSGTLQPAGERETLRVDLPRGALLSVAAKGKKQKGGAAPAVVFLAWNWICFGGPLDLGYAYKVTPFMA